MPTSATRLRSRRYKIADLTLDTGRRVVFRGDEPIALRPLTYELLRVLAEHAPDVVSNDELASRIWGSNRIVTPENLAKRVMLLRQALGDNAEQPRYIERVRCHGYRLIPAVEVIDGEDDAQVADSALAGAAAAAPRRGPFRLRWAAAAGAPLVAAALAFAAAAVFTANAPSDRAPPPRERSIAVLPFENRSATAEDAGFFAEGLHDDLITRLAAIEDIAVTPRASVLDFRAPGVSRRSIGQQLGVDVILDGSVQRAGEHVRVNVQLIDARTDETIWGESYDEELTAGNVFAIQKSIVTAIAEELQAKLTPAAARQLDERPTDNLRALDFYMRGREYERPPYAYWDLAATQYQRAIDEDPQFALAHARLSIASLLAFFASDGDRARLATAKAAAEEALRLQPDLALGRIALAFYLVSSTNEVERAYEELEAAAPRAEHDPQFYLVRAAVNARLGRTIEARADRATARALSPRDPATTMLDIAFAHSRNREYDEARRFVERALELRPDFPGAVVLKAQLALIADGDPKPLRGLSEEDFASDPGLQARLLELKWLAALYERDFQTAARILESQRDASTDVDFADRAARARVPFLLSMASTLRAAGKVDAARRLYAEGLNLSQGDRPEWRRWRAAFLAGCGQSDEAVRIAKELLAAITPDDPSGNVMRLWLAREVLVPAHAVDLAVAELDRYLSAPGSWAIEGLLPDPRLDPIRDEKPFRALVEKHKRS